MAEEKLEHNETIGDGTKIKTGSDKKLPDNIASMPESIPVADKIQKIMPAEKKTEENEILFYQKIPRTNKDLVLNVQWVVKSIKSLDQQLNMPYFNELLNRYLTIIESRSEEENLGKYFKTKYRDNDKNDQIKWIEDWCKEDKIVKNSNQIDILKSMDNEKGERLKKMIIKIIIKVIMLGGYNAIPLINEDLIRKRKVWSKADCTRAPFDVFKKMDSF